MNEFLNPKSMITPGVAGSIVMLVGNAVVLQFPEAPFRWVIVILSFVVGTIVFQAALPLMERLAFWAINSLIIFAVGIGTSNVAANVQQSARGAEVAKGASAGIQLVLTAAHAQAPVTDCDREIARLKVELATRSRELAELRASLNPTAKEPAASEERANTKFFRRW